MAHPFNRNEGFAELLLGILPGLHGDGRNALECRTPVRHPSDTVRSQKGQNNKRSATPAAMDKSIAAFEKAAQSAAFHRAGGSMEELELPILLATGTARQRMRQPEERGLEHSQTWGPGDHPLAAGGLKI